MSPLSYLFFVFSVVGVLFSLLLWFTVKRRRVLEKELLELKQLLGAQGLRAPGEE